MACSEIGKLVASEKGKERGRTEIHLEGKVLFHFFACVIEEMGSVEGRREKEWRGEIRRT